MDIEILRLTPELADDYVHFFDITPHDAYVDEHKCYCVCWCSDDYRGKDFSTVAKRRAAAHDYVKRGIIQGYLAYANNRPVGWCNANTKVDCLLCCSWRMFMQDTPVDFSIKTKSVFCFVIAPDMQRKGIASMLLERVISDAEQEGFDAIEAYPNKEFISVAEDFMGPLSLYSKYGFRITTETDKKYIVNKVLK